MQPKQNQFQFQQTDISHKTRKCRSNKFLSSTLRKMKKLIIELCHYPYFLMQTNINMFYGKQAVSQSVRQIDRRRHHSDESLPVPIRAKVNYLGFMFSQATNKKHKLIIVIMLLLLSQIYTVRNFSFIIFKKCLVNFLNKFELKIHLQANFYLFPSKSYQKNPASAFKFVCTLLRSLSLACFKNNNNNYRSQSDYTLY